jgi:hypothetical protein
MVIRASCFAGNVQHAMSHHQPAGPKAVLGCAAKPIRGFEPQMPIRAKSKCANDLKLICLSSPREKNISLSDSVDTAIERLLSRAHQEGRTRRHERGARDAMDVNSAD